MSNSQVKAKMSLSQEISVFLNHQYFFNRLMTLIFGRQIGMNKRNKAY